MMTFIRAIPMRSHTPTEYEKEQALFAKMQAELHPRKSLYSRIGLWAAAIASRLRRRTEPRHDTAPCADQEPVHPSVI